MTQETRIEIGQKIRRAREQNNLTQDQLALMVGIGRSYLAKVESGKRNPTVDFVEKVANGLDMTLEDLFKGL